MAHEVTASIRVLLPDDPQQMAETLGDIATAWSEFLAGVDQYGVDIAFTVNETRGKPGPKPAANGVPRQRKARTAGNSSAADGQGPLPDPMRAEDAA